MADASFLVGASATEVARRIKGREVSSVEVTEACLARIDALNSTYNAYITILREEALQGAADADSKTRSGGALGLLHGVPVSVKDALVMRGTATTLASPLLPGYRPPDDRDATCIERLRQEGAIILGKVNVGSGIAPYFGFTLANPPKNPWRPSHTPGGSSSGSAVAVALGMGYASIGTDLGGSIRIPAALTGVVGLKPTYGLVSQHGDIFCLSHTLEHVGPLTRTVSDAALVLQAVAGQDPKDPTSIPRVVPDYLRGIGEGLPDGTLRFGLVSQGGPLGAEPEVRDRVEAGARLLEDKGEIVEEVELPSFSEEFWYLFTLLDEWEQYDARQGENRSYLAYIRTRLTGLRRKTLSHMQTLIEELRRAYRALFERFDVLVLPTTPVWARPFDVRRVYWAGRERETLDVQLCNAWMFNFTGHPAISLPCGFSPDGLPIALQMVGRHLEEDRLFRVAAIFEQRSGGFPMPDVDKLLRPVDEGGH